jgi:DHA1 family tetracycline resistance protein-like MFS transporter
VIALYLLILVDSISIAVVIPLLGPLLIDPATQVFLVGTPLHLRNLVTGLLVAVYVLLMLYMAPVLGRLSDQVGRRPVLLVCGLGVLLGNLLAGLGIESQSLALLFLGRVVAGATAASQITAQAAQVDLGSDKAARLSFSLLFSSLGFVVGPIVASTLSSWSLAAPLYFCAILSALAVALLAMTYREAQRPARRLDASAISIFEGVRCFRDAVADPRVRGLLACFLLMQIAWGSYFVFVSVFMMHGPRLRFSLGQVGIFMSLMGVGFCLANGLVQPLLARRFSMRGLAVSGLALTACAMVICLMAIHPYQAYLAALVTGVTVNVAYPSIVTMLSDRVAADQQGWILGMVGSAVALGWAISSLISGAIGGWGHSLPIVLAGVVMASSALAAVVVTASSEDNAPGHGDGPRA